MFSAAGEPFYGGDGSCRGDALDSAFVSIVNGVDGFGGDGVECSVAVAGTENACC